MNSEDIAKLHAESLQLRSQQFQLATISLAGSGLTAWIAPGLTALTQGMVPELALLGGTIFWLILLTFLYVWSLSLRALIAVISHYLDLTHSSQWEADYREFSKATEGKLHSQTWFTAIIFSVYGVIAAAGGALAALAAPEKVQLSKNGLTVLVIFLCIYIITVFALAKRRSAEFIRNTWERVLAAKSPAGSAEVSPAPPADPDRKP